MQDTKPTTNQKLAQDAKIKIIIITAMFILLTLTVMAIGIIAAIKASEKAKTTNQVVFSPTKTITDNANN